MCSLNLQNNLVERGFIAYATKLFSFDGNCLKAINLLLFFNLVRSTEEREHGDDSDYYTPEEPAPSQPGPLYESDISTHVLTSVEGTPQNFSGSPISHASARSSGDSYTSGSSTRRLLVVEGSTTLPDRSVNV